jgi:hypothetical protein
MTTRVECFVDRAIDFIYRAICILVFCVIVAAAFVGLLRLIP